MTATFFPHLQSIDNTGKPRMDSIANGKTSLTTTNISYQLVTDLSATITPSSASSKVLIAYCLDLGGNSGASVFEGRQLFRDGVQIGSPTSPGSRIPTMGISDHFNDTSTQQTVMCYFLDSPATTSQVTYTIKVGGDSASSSTTTVNGTSADTNSNVNFKGTSSIFLLEI